MVCKYFHSLFTLHCFLGSFTDHYMSFLLSVHHISWIVCRTLSHYLVAMVLVSILYIVMLLTFLSIFYGNDDMMFCRILRVIGVVDDFLCVYTKQTWILNTNNGLCIGTYSFSFQRVPPSVVIQGTLTCLREWIRRVRYHYMSHITRL